MLLQCKPESVIFHSDLKVINCDVLPVIDGADRISFQGSCSLLISKWPTDFSFSILFSRPLHSVRTSPDSWQTGEKKQQNAGWQGRHNDVEIQSLLTCLWGLQSPARQKTEKRQLAGNGNFQCSICLTATPGNYFFTCLNPTGLTLIIPLTKLAKV